MYYLIEKNLGRPSKYFIDLSITIYTTFNSLAAGVVVRGREAS